MALGGLLWVSMAGAGCAVRRQAQYDPALAPHVHADGVTLALLAMDETKDDLHATIRITNERPEPIHLTAPEWRADWAQVRWGHGQAMAGVAVTIVDADAHWPADKPLRRPVDIPPYQHRDFLLSCSYQPPRRTLSTGPSILVQTQDARQHAQVLTLVVPPDHGD